MEGAPKITYDFVMGQLRVALVAALAYASGKGWLTPTDAGALTAVATGLGPLMVPWAWSVFVNLGVVHVQSGSAAATIAKVETAAPAAAAEVADKLAKGVGMALALMLAASLLMPDLAQAQQRPRLPIDPLGLNDRTERDPLERLLGALDDKLLPDLQYALKLAEASGSKVTAPCYQAWIEIIQTRKQAVKGDDGQELPPPNPGVVTKFEKMVELRNALQPDSNFMVKCSPVASMVKKDIAGFIGIVISGGAGLATLVPGL